MRLIFLNDLLAQLCFKFTRINKQIIVINSEKKTAIAEVSIAKK